MGKKLRCEEGECPFGNVNCSNGPFYECYVDVPLPNKYQNDFGQFKKVNKK